MSNYSQSVLAEYEILDSRAMAVLKEIVLGLDNAIEDQVARVKQAIESPENLYLMPIVLKKHLAGYDKVYRELAAFAERYLFVSTSANLAKMGFNFERELRRYREQVNSVWGVFAKDPHDLLISLQYRLKEALSKQKKKEEEEILVA